MTKTFDSKKWTRLTCALFKDMKKQKLKVTWQRLQIHSRLSRKRSER
jgi:hypothetical protein